MNIYFLTITILIHKISNLYSEGIQEIIISNDINNIQNYRYHFKTKGIQLIFDLNSSINVIPAKIKTEIYENGLNISNPYDEPFIVPIDDGYSKLRSMVCDNNMFPSLNLIFKNYGITFPTNYLFPKIGNKLYEFIFLIHNDIENIIIGRDLIELMDINFEKGVEIRNKDFVIKLNDE